MENNTVNNNAEINCVLLTYNCQPVFAHPCIFLTSVSYPIKREREQLLMSLDNYEEKIMWGKVLETVSMHMSIKIAHLYYVNFVLKSCKFCLSFLIGLKFPLDFYCIWSTIFIVYKLQNFSGIANDNRIT